MFLRFVVAGLACMERLRAIEVFLCSISLASVNSTVEEQLSHQGTLTEGEGSVPLTSLY
jgi:hypothetical protein